MLKGTNRIAGFTILFVALFYFFLIYVFRWEGNDDKHHKNIIASDGTGYYDYLPRYLLGNPNRGVFDHRYHVLIGKDTVNKYYIGTALLESPFFAGAWVYCKITGENTDGYSPPFQYAHSLSSLFYYLASLWLLWLILLRLLPLRPIQAALLLLILSFGTVMMYYIIIYASFSHAYSFFSVALFFYSVSGLAHENINKNSVLLFPVALSLIFIIRPVNVIVLLLVPFFFTNFHHLAGTFRKITHSYSGTLLLGITLALIPPLLQCLTWQEQCGRWIVWSYGNEGFRFADPHFFDFLFSYKKGLFVYCPSLLILFSGIIFILKKNKWKFLWAGIFTLVSWYILCSWWSWHYGGGLAIRPAADFFIIFIICGAYLLMYAARWLRYVIACSLMLCTALNFVYCYQYYQGIIHPSAMNGEKYWYVFLKTGEKYNYCLGGSMDIIPYSPKGFDTLFIKKQDFSNQPEGILNLSGIEFPYGEFITLEGDRCHHNCHWLTVKMKRQVKNSSDGKNITLDIHASRDDTISVFYEPVKIKELPEEEPGKWMESEYRVAFFDRFHCGNKIGIYFYNPKKEAMLIDDLEIEFYGVKK